MPRQRQPKKTQVSFRIPIETLAAVRAEAKEDGKPMSEILRSIWDLRCRIKKLAPNQRLAIVSTLPINGTNENGETKTRTKITEYITLRGMPNSNGRS